MQISGSTTTLNPPVNPKPTPQTNTEPGKKVPCGLLLFEVQPYELQSRRLKRGLYYTGSTIGVIQWDILGV